MIYNTFLDADKEKKGYTDIFELKDAFRIIEI